MSQERKVELASRLLRLGVSQEGVIDLLGRHDIEVVEAQINYLPFRGAKRPEAFIIEAVRRNYSPPKEFYYAQAKAELAPAFDPVDQSPERPLRPAPSHPEGYGAEGVARPLAGDSGMEPSDVISIPELPEA